MYGNVNSAAAAVLLELHLEKEYKSVRKQRVQESIKNKFAYKYMYNWNISCEHDTKPESVRKP
jgi:hypothetical protein